MEFVNTKNTLATMYRYLLKYVGTYRVKAEYDWKTNDFPRNETNGIEDSFEDLYIPCSKGIIKHTYLGDDILALCFYDKAQQGRNIFSMIAEKYPKLQIEIDDDGTDCLIYFNANDIKKIATICKPKTSGKDIQPFSIKNLPKVEYKIPSSDLSKLYTITKDLSQSETLQFFKKVNTDFIKTLNKEVQAEKKQSRLSTKEFIHSNGLWDKYLSYVKKQYKKSLK